MANGTHYTVEIELPKQVVNVWAEDAADACNRAVWMIGLAGVIAAATFEVRESDWEEAAPA